MAILIKVRIKRLTIAKCGLYKSGEVVCVLYEEAVILVWLGLADYFEESRKIDGSKKPESS